MDGSYPGKLRVWEAWNFMGVSDPSVLRSGRPGITELAPAESAGYWYARETFATATSARGADGLAEPFSLQWFLQIESRRHQRYARWIPRLLEFSKHAGETLLGVGGGLGTDWAQYALHGAAVVVCNPTAEELALARRNFELRGLPARFLHASPASLPLDNATVDVVCVGSLPAGLNLASLVEEMHRVLKPGGKVVVLAPARMDIDHWSELLFPWRSWLYASTSQTSKPEAQFTARELRRIFGRFIEHRIHKRHLRRAEVPHLWRWLPLPMLERWFGHFLILKAFKSVSAPIPVPVAA